MKQGSGPLYSILRILATLSFGSLLLQWFSLVIFRPPKQRPGGAAAANDPSFAMEEGGGEQRPLRHFCV